MPVQQMLQEKMVSVSEAVALVNSGDTIDYGFSVTQSDIFDTELAKQKDRLKDVIVRGTLSVAARQIIEQDPDQQHFEYQNWHFSGYDRKKSEQGVVSYIPFNFGEGPHIYREYLKTDVLVLKTSPMDK